MIANFVILTVISVVVVACFKVYAAHRDSAAASRTLRKGSRR